MKRILCILSLLASLPVCAGEFDNAIKNYDKVFLYLYTPACGYCNKFNPVYQRVSKDYGAKCKFIKVDANTKEGTNLMNQFGARYVPYVVTIDNKAHVAGQVPPECLLNYECTDKVLGAFTK